MLAYEWACLRVVPDVRREEFLNAGVVLYCAPLDHLRAGVDLDVDRLRALAPDVDVATVRAHLDHIVAACAGEPSAGPAAGRPLGPRFRWLTAPRSTVVQTSQIHTGLTDDPDAELERLLDVMVRRPGAVTPRRSRT